MALRLLDLVITESQADKLRKLAEELPIQKSDLYKLEDGGLAARLVVDAEDTEEVIEKLEKAFGDNEDFHLLVLPVEAVLPRPKEEETTDTNEFEKKNRFIRISREELYDDMSEATKWSYNFVFLMVLSSVVAGIGILQDDVAILIGAMVIAPLIGPQMSLGFASTLGDLSLIRKSIITGLIGTGIGLGIGLFWGLLDPSVQFIDTSRGIQLSFVGLALASGTAGALSVIRGLKTNLVGVMVAVALLPPLVKGGLLLGAQSWVPALHTGLLFATNIICINLAAVLTFWLSGIRPSMWWEAQKAKKQRGRAVLLWSIALVLLVAAILLLQFYEG